MLPNNPRILKEPAAGIGIGVLADSLIQLPVKLWTNMVDFRPVGSEINKAIVGTSRSRNVVIAFPQYEVHMLGNAVWRFGNAGRFALDHRFYSLHLKPRESCRPFRSP